MDARNDIGRNAPAIRRAHLRAYLRERSGKARWVVIGEALGYRGGHFSGIPMTSERMLLGEVAGIDPQRIFSGVAPRRTSKREISSHGFSEPTATIVWRTLLELGLCPEDFVLWNAFPWHSFNPRRGLLSNRTPNKSECAAGLPALKAGENCRCTAGKTGRRFPPRSSSSLRRRKAFSPTNGGDCCKERQFLNRRLGLGKGPDLFVG